MYLVGGAFTLVECCRVPEFYYGSCEVRGGTWGELLECPQIHSENGHLIEGFCESGKFMSKESKVFPIWAWVQKKTTVKLTNHRP